MKFRKLAICFALTFFGAMSNASATIIHIVYDMNITFHGTDGAGLFGAPSMNYSGQTVHLDFRFDTTQTDYYVQPPNAYLRGNSGTTATITVNGHSFTLKGNGDAYDTYSIGGSSCSATACTHMSQRVVDTNGYIWANAQGGPIPVSLEVPHVMTADYLRGKGMNGGLVYGNSLGLTEFSFGSTISDFPSWETARVLVGDGVSAVPEPSTWAMLILGLAGVGALSYHRSRKNPLTAA